MAGYGLEETYHLDRLLQQDLAALNISNQVVNASVSGDTSNGGLSKDWPALPKELMDSEHVPRLLRRYTRTFLVLTLGCFDQHHSYDGNLVDGVGQKLS